MGGVLQKDVFWIWPDHSNVISLQLWIPGQDLSVQNWACQQCIMDTQGAYEALPFPERLLAVKDW